MLLWWWLLILLVPDLAHSAITSVRNSTQGSCSSVTSCATSFSVLPATGNAVAVKISCWKTSTCGAITVTDNQGVGNTYSQAVAKTEASGSSEAAIFYVSQIGTTSGTFTITASIGAAASWEITATEYTGWLTSGALDQISSNNSGTGTADSLATPTTTQADELVICVTAVSANNASLGISTPTGYTQTGIQNNSAATIGFEAADKIVSATGTQQCQWTHSTTGLFGWSAVIATFKAAPTSTRKKGGVIFFP